MGSKTEYYKNLVFPCAWLVLMNVIIALGIVQPLQADYFYCLYFGGFFIYFVFIKKDINIKCWLSNMRHRSFWKSVIVTMGLMALFYGIGYLPNILFPAYNVQFLLFPIKRAYDMPTKIAFFLSAIVFPALGQELFYRKAMIKFDNRNAIIISTIVGSLLFGVNDNLDLFGMIRSSLLGIAFALPYIRTRNRYVPITSHYLASIILSYQFFAELIP